jgi:hypothetical protein
MIRVIKSSNGTYKFKNVMIDINGTGLVEGIDVYFEDEFIGGVNGYYNLEDYDGNKLVEIGSNLLNS